ncbi:sensor histidine kinase [Streptomyces sp. WMMC940]|uniref:sensor histidine kinase n=1 Tax=Streptomyces sp. WMMC940 TaxID=3015153 RepID=UPI0022B617AF|nr:histidine kinase [Streptomyces sp. WMMC940]MCZ7456131.1 histidine kinase [Streptomyces sp. WMMC940]
MRFPIPARVLDALTVLLAASASVVAVQLTVRGYELFPQLTFGPLGTSLDMLELSRMPVQEAVAVLACLALLWRHRRPTPLAVGLIVAGAFLPLAVPAMVALFSVAVHRPPQTTVRVAVLALAPAPLFYTGVVYRAWPFLSLDTLIPGLVSVALVAVVVGWGLFVRALHERAERAEAEAALRAERAQRAAREEIAREMHDVLAHRLSLLSVHAGALEFHPGAPEHEVEHAAGVIRESAHRALQDLRTVIGVLRAPTAEETGAPRPQPALADLTRLAQESRQAGMCVQLEQRIAQPDAVPELTGRTVYRIAQEGLTNARKHAPGVPVQLEIGGGPGDGVTVEVRNRAPRPGARPSIPGSGQGLIGLAERTALAGGRLEHGRSGKHFELRAWLPWSA